MSIFSAIALLAVIWFMTLFVILPLNLTTQDEAGTRVRGTMGSSPVEPRLKRKFILTSIIALVLWLMIVGAILSSWITMDDFDLYHRFGGPGG